MSRNKIAFVIVLIPAFLFLQGCQDGWQEDSDLHFYESEFTDSIINVINQDSIPILLFHTRKNYRDSGIVQIEFYEDSALQDTVKIYLSILFGNYKPTPTPYKGDSLINDTLYIWYLLYQEPGYPKYVLPSSITNVNYPAPSYYRVKNVDIYKSLKKEITFKTRFRY